MLLNNYLSMVLTKTRQRRESRIKGVMKAFQVVYGNIPKEINECMNSVKRFYPQVEVHNFDKVDNPVHDSDIFRVCVLGSFDDILYIDWDILLTGRLELVKNGFPCCNFYKNAPDYSLVYSPDRKFWVGFEIERLKRNISKDIYGWPRKILRKNKNINEIKGNFIHLRTTKGGSP